MRETADKARLKTIEETYAEHSARFLEEAAFFSRGWPKKDCDAEYASNKKAAAANYVKRRGYSYYNG